LTNKGCFQGSHIKQIKISESVDLTLHMHHLQTTKSSHYHRAIDNGSLGKNIYSVFSIYISYEQAPKQDFKDSTNIPDTRHSNLILAKFVER